MSDRPPIIYVDDEESAVVIFEAAFDDDYELYLARSAREALEILHRVPIHLVVADQRMPGMTGVQLLEVIQNEFPDVMRMILTGYSDIDTIIRAINSGRVHHYAAKPWKPRELRLVIDRALDGHALREQNRQLEEQLKQKVAREREIRRAFQRFAPPAVVDALSSSRPLAAESRIVAALYCHIHGFDQMNSQLPGDQMIALLNGLLQAMHTAAARHQGTIIDPQLAVFGAPISSLTNAENALQAALSMLDALQDFNLGTAIDLLGEPISAGIGIHLGEVVTGSIGSAEKMEYTVIGEAVDLARRLWKFTEAGSDTILITRRVRERTSHLSDAEALPPVVLQSAAEATEIFRVVVP